MRQCACVCDLAQAILLIEKHFMCTLTQLVFQSAMFEPYSAWKLQTLVMIETALLRFMHRMPLPYALSFNT